MSVRRIPERWRLTLLAALAVSCPLLAARAGAAPPGAVASPHADLPCAACHPAPHGPPAATCTDGGCHQATAVAFRASDHDRLHLRDADLLTSCPACHVSHLDAAGAALPLRDRARQLQASCLSCHPTSVVAEGHGSPAGDGGTVSADLPATRAAPSRPTCFDCHGAHATLVPTDVAASCGRCHRRQADSYAASSHAAAVAGGDAVAPTCVSCHGAHVAVADTPAKAAATCASCHDRPEVLRRTGLLHARTDGRRRTFHGLALAHGVTDVATCTSCHGAHAVVAASDPRSPVSSARIASTCATCHSRATPAMLASVSGGGVRSHASRLLHLLEIGFPIAGTRLNILAVAAVGATAAFLSSLFGVGGGLLLTPLLILLGVPGAVAAASDSAQITATATAATRSHAQRRSVDFRLAALLAAAGVLGGTVGVQAVRALRVTGSYEPLLRLLFVCVMLAFGLVMGRQSLWALRGRPHQRLLSGRSVRLFDRLPLQLATPHPGTRISLLVPLAAGLAAGLAAAMLGVGGGFLVLPILVSSMGVPIRLAVGTASLGVAVTSASVALQHAGFNHTVDLFLAGTLFLGSLAGSRLGRLVSRRMQRDRVRLFLSVIVLAVAAALLLQLLETPPSAVLLGADL